MKKPKPTGKDDPPPPRRGKRTRKPHWIYNIEDALGLDHSDIARLLTPEPLSVEAVWDILEGRYDTSALKGLRFPVTKTRVGDIIAGESLLWAEKAAALLSKRLGFSLEDDADGKQTPRVYEPAHREEVPFNIDWVSEYLRNWERQMQYAYFRQASPFIATSPPTKTPRVIRFDDRGRRIEAGQDQASGDQTP